MTWYLQKIKQFLKILKNFKYLEKDKVSKLTLLKKLTFINK